jgi:hypothetical protein
MKKRIKIHASDILEYVIGNSSYDAIEKVIDPTRYEIFEDGIFDHETGDLIEQGEEYQVYLKQVANLKKHVPQMGLKEIKSICEEIEEISPQSIIL